MSSREQFEAWAKKEKLGITYGDCGYVFSSTEMAWRAWQAMEAKCAALAAENAGLNSFVDSLLSIAWQGGSADGADIEELALNHGLLRQEVYSADEHENQVDDPGNFEDGDPVYFRVETPATNSFLAEVRAQGVEAAAQSEQFSMWVQQGLRSFAIGLRQGDWDDYQTVGERKLNNLEKAVLECADVIAKDKASQSKGVQS